MDATDSDSGELAAPRDKQRNTNWRHRQNALRPDHLYQMQFLRTLEGCFYPAHAMVSSAYSV